VIVNHLSVIQDMYRRYEDFFVLNDEFADYFERSISDKTSHFLVLSLAYEAKDYGPGIERDNKTDKIAHYLIRSKDASESDLATMVNFIAMSLFSKYFVFSNKNEYLSYYKELLKIGYQDNRILTIFKDSFEELRKSFIYLDLAFKQMSHISEEENLMYFVSLFHKEGAENYALLNVLGVEDSYPNIDSSYVYMDQINNPDFWITAANNLHEWCKKNAKD